MHESVDRVVTPFLAAADAALGPGYSALLYGSAARGDYIPGRSNINLMLVLDDPSPTRLRALGRAFAAWRKAGRAAAPASAGPNGPARRMRSRSRSPTCAPPTGCSAAPIRCGAARVEPADLRQALEREFRGKLLRLRQGYAAAAGDASAGRAGAAERRHHPGAAARAAEPGGHGRAAAPAALAAGPRPLVGLPAGALVHVVAHRGEREWRCNASEFEHYMDAVEQAAGFLDQLQLGDQ